MINLVLDQKEDEAKELWTKILDDNKDLWLVKVSTRRDALKTF